MAEDALQKAERLAEEEGLTLIRSGGVTGFRWVTVDDRKGDATYRARRHNYRSRPGDQTSNFGTFDLGCFSSAAEAALAIARHLGPDASRDEAATGSYTRNAPEHEFGVSRRHQEVVVPALEVVCDDDDEASGDDEVEAAAVVVPATEVGAKRKRPAAAECTPATKMASQHALRAEDAVVEHGVAYINVAVRVPVGMRVPTSVTVEWAP